MSGAAIRGRGKVTQAATWTFEDPNRRRFQLIGVAHVADRQFWTHLRERLLAAEYRGYQVHYERIKPDPDAPAVDAVPLEERPYYGLAKLLDMESQYTGLVPQPHWTNTDMSIPELFAAIRDPEPLRKMLTDMNKPWVMPDPVPPLIVPLSRWVLRHPSAIAAITWLKQPREVRRLLLNGRTDYAMSRMLNTGDDVVTVWGAAHLPRMADWLRKSGFELVRTAWYTCISPPVDD
jgi:hypothetical protein